MERTPVIIIGAGPSGLVMGLSLAKYKISSVILEKESEITEDPRGVVLNQDANRIAADLGIVDQLKHIGHELETVMFHKSSFASAPYWSISLAGDTLDQGLPTALLQVQPRLERAMQDQIVESTFCDLRRGCTVRSVRQSPHGMEVEYEDRNGSFHSVLGSWVVGADGKKGILRKHYLEEIGGVKQVDGIYSYEGTWIAANLRMSLPTPETHPEFPLWKLGYTPQKVYDLFWPRHWHFCSPPGKPTATGRFGPHEARLWRHELAQLDWNDSMSAEECFWEHITPMITRSTGEDLKSRFPTGPVTYPRDCIEILRVRPFTFAHKVVNKWFDDRAILIGDSAHVFPPFGGQGIASGMRDAHQLAWRLALLVRLNMSKSVADRLLVAWAAERRQSVDDAARATMMNGKLCNEPETVAFAMFRRVAWLLEQFGLGQTLAQIQSDNERNGFKPTKNGWYLSSYHGGGKISQTMLYRNNAPPQLSDCLLRHEMSLMTLFVVINQGVNTEEQAKSMVQKAGLDASVLAEESIILFDKKSRTLQKSVQSAESYEVYHFDEQIPTSTGASSNNGMTAFEKRFGALTRFALVRPDFYVFALLKDERELEDALMQLKAMSQHLY